MRTAVVVLLSAATLVRARGARGEDPLFGPTVASTPRASASGAPSGFSEVVSDVVDDVEDRMIRTVRPGYDPRALRGGPARRDIITHFEDRPLHFFRGLQVRRSGMADYVLGPALPVDLVSGVMPGTLLAFRLGAEAGSLGGYAIAGGGTFTAFEHGLPGRDSAFVSVSTRSAPKPTKPYGAELRMFRAILLAAELDWGRLAIGRDGATVTVPDPTETVRTAVFALRVEY
jgi:hypothetical protein